MKIKSLATILVCGVLFAWTEICSASIISMNAIKINLTDSNDAKSKAIWSDSNYIKVNSGGLGWNGEDNASRDFWLQTEEMPVGLSWRPTQSANIRVEIAPPFNEITLSNGQKHTPYIGSVYMRHSPDTKHWSSWQIMQSDGEKNGKYVFTGQMRIPQKNRIEYNKYWELYRKLDVPWVSDEDAMVRWIIKQDPTFFEINDPFVGYVQIMYDSSLPANQRIKEINISAYWGVSGLQQPPKDPNYMKLRNGDEPWKYKANLQNSKEYLVYNFESVQELVISYESRNAIVDLDTNKTWGPAARGTSKDYHPGADIWADFYAPVKKDATNIALGSDILVIEGVEEDWDITPSNLINRFWASSSKSSRNRSPLVTGNDKIPKTFLFKTLQGGYGVLQITGFS